MCDLREGLLLGLGNPLLDISANVCKSLLDKYNLKADNAILAEDHHKPIYDELIHEYNAEYLAGGSVQNALRVAQWLLQRSNVTTFFGCVGNDKYSKILEDKARSAGVNVQYQYTDTEPTGTCAVLITDSQRSLCANLAAANCFTIDHMHANWQFVDKAEFYYVSGYFLTVSPQTILEIAKYALTKNRIFIMNLSAPFISQFYKKELMETFPYVDILFGNEMEADTFGKEQNIFTENRKELIKRICKLPKLNSARERITVITQGADPVLLSISNSDQVFEFPAEKLTKEQLVDTNGAGDAFAGGFLSQLIQNQSIETCIKCGIWAATHIIQRSGCTFDNSVPPSFQP